MKFIRENIVKILLVVGILLVLIVILIACSGSGNGGRANSYSRMEDNFKNAATKFLSKHQDLLPTEEGKIVKVQMDSVYTKKQMDKMVAIDDDTVKCDGYVNVNFRINKDDEKSYRVVPHIKCGDKYETEDLYIHILKNEDVVTELDGLYKIGDEYIFRGENPNNYVQIGEHLYRIMSIDKDGYIKLVGANKSYLYSAWDDRYNVETGKYDGINDYYISRIRIALNEHINDEDAYSDVEKNVFVKHSYCIGLRSEGNLMIDRTEECSKTIDEDYLSLPIIYDYYIASIDPNCKTIKDESCNNYNYLESLRSIYTLTGSKEHSSYVYSVDDIVNVDDAKSGKRLAIIAYIANVSYSSGKGTIDNPYIIK